jgi:tRNA (guanine26-N2/guanine27-N2)-dimethyltransferase
MPSPKAADTVIEGGHGFFVGKGVFYNPHMELSRTLSSLAVREINEDLNILDACSASGIRGMRYALECRNVKNVDFLDADKNALKSVKKNMKKHKMGGSAIEAEAIRYMLTDGDGKHNFIELDPFGSPVAFLHSAVRSMRKLKTAYLSITATDTAVLCGTHPRPCLRDYHSKPMRNSFCHETGLRILVRRAMEAAHEFNFGIEPLLCFYYRHQMKAILMLRRGAEFCDANMANIGYVFSDDTNGVHVEASEKPIVAKKVYDYAGPLWAGDLSDRKVAENALGNASGEAKRMLGLIIGELGYPPFFLSIADMAAYRKKSPPKIENVVSNFERLGGSAVKTHFDRGGMKYKGDFGKLVEAFDRS